MDDPLIAGGAAVATLLLIAINWLLGGWRAARIHSESTARARYAQDFPDDCILDAVIDCRGRAALLATDNPRIVGLVVAMGDRMATRRLFGRDLRATVFDDRGVTLRLDDFVLPRVRLDLDGAMAQTWRTRLSCVTEEETARDAA